jgi:hypothetical protein
MLCGVHVVDEQRVRVRAARHSDGRSLRRWWAVTGSVAAPLTDGANDRGVEFVRIGRGRGTRQDNFDDVLRLLAKTIERGGTRLRTRVQMAKHVVRRFEISGRNAVRNRRANR